MLIPASTLERILIKPYFPKELDYVKASTRTIKGPVESSWRKEDGRTRLKVSIPANTTALVYLPADPSSVTESAMEAGKAPGVHYLRKENKTLIYEIASGEYEFTFSDAK
jgi:alpha-L-rhamnosidase